MEEGKERDRLSRLSAEDHQQHSPAHFKEGSLCCCVASSSVAHLSSLVCSSSRRNSDSDSVFSASDTMDKFFTSDTEEHWNTFPALKFVGKLGHYLSLPTLRTFPYFKTCGSSPSGCNLIMSFGSFLGFYGSSVHELFPSCVLDMQMTLFICQPV